MALMRVCNKCLALSACDALRTGVPPSTARRPPVGIFTKDTITRAARRTEISLAASPPMLTNRLPERLL